MIESYLYKPDKSVEINPRKKNFKEILSQEGNLLWLDIQDIEDADIEILLNVFGLHTLTVEDLIMPNPHPKIESFENYLFLITHGIKIKGDNGDLQFAEVDICLGKNFIITVHTEDLHCIKAEKGRATNHPLSMSRGTDFFLYSLLDSMVEDFIPVVDKLDEKIEEMEDELFANPTPHTLNKIYGLKKNLLFIRRTTGIERDLIGRLARGEYSIIRPETCIYFRDTYDHLVRVDDLVNTSRDIITSALEAYVSVVSNRLNGIIKTLTIFATVMTPPIVIASIYGMNVKFPFFITEYGHAFLWIISILCGIGIWFLFKRWKWL